MSAFSISVLIGIIMTILVFILDSRSYTWTLFYMLTIGIIIGKLVSA